jgi:hypothetical protein
MFRLSGPGAIVKDKKVIYPHVQCTDNVVSEPERWVVLPLF